MPVFANFRSKFSVVQKKQSSLSVSGPMCDRLPRKFGVQTSYKSSNYVLRLICVVKIKFPRETYHTIVPSTEELYCLNSAHLAKNTDAYYLSAENLISKAPYIFAFSLYFSFYFFFFLSFFLSFFVFFLLSCCFFCIFSSKIRTRYTEESKRQLLGGRKFTGEQQKQWSVSVSWRIGS